ncbi:tRNA pseudouridine(38-40) synthase TruA [Alteribacillus bidgolensis]|uniref:tRNA pseudouridine synthase A n=1 Tax=Alteribacillus bidgolensis TaxID=930129 RepID=A0A1G8PBD3_9BACI|nr:tRNA pseudouridine(38-40) synthase TruA [Alteribacillus bidgolensis]SDI89707.1 tRNA pseudouridine38-40 synthase [Alteribacillus bidgolensis]
MQRVKAVVSYEGTFFSGWQKQPGKRTVQEEIETALISIQKGQKTKVTASGRTDASVHAIAQVIHFDTSLSIPADKWPKAINSKLPEDIQIKEAEYTSSDFHARFDAVEKEYRYRVLPKREKDIFRRNTTFFYPYPIEVAEIKKAAAYLKGTHDFSSFCASGTDVVNMVRTVYKAEVLEKGDELHFIFRGNGFLYNMVRIMVGTLLEVGKGMRRPEDILEVIYTKKRSAAGKTAPGHALYLWEVCYEK